MSTTPDPTQIPINDDDEPIDEQPDAPKDTSTNTDTDDTKSADEPEDSDKKRWSLPWWLIPALAVLLLVGLIGWGLPCNGGSVATTPSPVPATPDEPEEVVETPPPAPAPNAVPCKGRAAHFPESDPTGTTLYLVYPAWNADLGELTAERYHWRIEGVHEVSGANHCIRVDDGHVGDWVPLRCLVPEDGVKSATNECPALECRWQSGPGTQCSESTEPATTGDAIEVTAEDAFEEAAEASETVDRVIETDQDEDSGTTDEPGESLPEDAPDAS